MSSMYPGHQGMRGVPPANGGAGRLNELLDQIRAEFESHVRQTETYEHQSTSSCPDTTTFGHVTDSPSPGRRVACRAYTNRFSNSSSPSAGDANDS
jgi:hypothetical protein